MPDPIIQLYWGNQQGSMEGGGFMGQLIWFYLVKNLLKSVRKCERLLLDRYSSIEGQ